jgi:hypothetical protein
VALAHQAVGPEASASRSSVRDEANVVLKLWAQQGSDRLRWRSIVEQAHERIDQAAVLVRCLVRSDLAKMLSNGL